MRKIINKERLINMSNEDIRKVTKGYAIDFHLYDGLLTQLCINDLQGFNKGNFQFYTNTGITIPLSKIKSIELIGDDC